METTKEKVIQLINKELAQLRKTNLSNAILIEKLEKENKELSIWKEEAMEVMSQFQMQEIGKVLNIELGDSISKQTLPSIKKLIAENEELVDLLNTVFLHITPLIRILEEPYKSGLKSRAKQITELLNKVKPKAI